MTEETKSLSIRFPIEIYKMIAHGAVERGLSKNQEVVRLVREQLEFEQTITGSIIPEERWIEIGIELNKIVEKARRK